MNKSGKELLAKITEALQLRFPGAEIRIDQQESGRMLVYVNGIQIFDMEKMAELLHQLREGASLRDS